MFPANVMVFSQLAGGGCTVGDHNTAAYKQPDCLATQFSSALDCVPGSGKNAVNFTITRPLSVPSPAVSIVAGQAYSVIGAIATTASGALPSAPICPNNTKFNAHVSAFSGGAAISFY